MNYFPENGTFETPSIIEFRVCVKVLCIIYASLGCSFQTPNPSGGAFHK